MSSEESDDPKVALVTAEENGWLRVPAASSLAPDDWEVVVSDWVSTCHDDGRAAIAVFEDIKARATVTYLAPPTKHFMGPRLEAAGTTLASQHVDGAGFADGPFGSWSTRKCDVAVAVELAKKLRYLDRFARRRDAAAAYEKGEAHNWGIVADVMES